MYTIIPSLKTMHIIIEETYNLYDTNLVSLDHYARDAVETLEIITHLLV